MCSGHVHATGRAECRFLDFKKELSFSDFQTFKDGIKTPLLACVTNVFTSDFPLEILHSNKDQQLLFRKQNLLCTCNSDSTEAVLTWSISFLAMPNL